MQPFSSRNVLRHQALFVVFIASFMLIAHFGAGPSNALAQPTVHVVETIGEKTPLSGPTTIRTTVHLGENVPTEQGFWLAGLAPEPYGEPTELGVALAQVGTGWLGPRWGVFLHGAEHIIPKHLAPLDGSGLLDGHVYIQLHNNSLPWGQTYEVTLGYDPGSGIASVSVYDVTAEQYVVNRNIQLERTDKTLYPVAGIGSLQADDANESQRTLGAITDFRVSENIVPAPFSWWIMQRSGTRPFTSTQHIDRRQETVVSIHLPWDDIPGTIKLRLEDEQSHTVLTVADATAEEYVPLPVDTLAAGPYRAVVAYDDGTTTWPLAERSVLVGTMHMELQSVHVVEHNEERMVLEGIIDVSSDGPLGDVEVALLGNIIEHAIELDDDGRTARTEKRTTEQLTLVEFQSLDASSSGQLPFRTEIAVPRRISEAGWELKIEPIASADEYALPAERTALWLQRPTDVYPWLGFLQDEDAVFTRWADGVDVVSLNGQLSGGPLKMHVVTIDLTEPHIGFDALIGTDHDAENGRWLRSKVGDMVMQQGALLGINAAFFDIRNTMNPSGMIIQSGRVLKSGPRPVIALEQNNNAYIGTWQWHGTVQSARSNESRTVVGLNETNMNNGIGMYRWPATRTAGQDVQVVITDVTEEDDETSFNRIVRGVVEAVHVGEGPLVLTPDTVVLGASGNHGMNLQHMFDVGDEVIISYRLIQTEGTVVLDDWRDLWSAVSGGVVLLADGAYGESSVQSDTARHPRTAVAISEDRTTLYWLVAEGRSVNSIGMTYEDMADYFLYLGAVDALNLDGGGSSTLAGRDPQTDKLTIINVTSDGGQRDVPDGLGLFIKE